MTAYTDRDKELNPTMEEALEKLKDRPNVTVEDVYKAMEGLSWCGILRGALEDVGYSEVVYHLEALRVE